MGRPAGTTSLRLPTAGGGVAAAVAGFAVATARSVGTASVDAVGGVGAATAAAAMLGIAAGAVGACVASTVDAGSGSRFENMTTRMIATTAAEIIV